MQQKKDGKSPYLMACLALPLTLFCSNAQEKPLTVKQVEAWKIPGEHQIGQCFAYAFILDVVLKEHGIESKIITCDWNDAPQGHAMVLFWLNGRRYIIDNEQDKALRVTGATDLECVRCFLRDADSIRDNPAESFSASDCVLLLGALETARAEGGFK